MFFLPPCRGALWRALVLALFLKTAIGAAQAQDIVIGQVAPLSGVLASTGEQMVLGGRIWFEHVNAQGGIHGQKLRVEVRDDGYKVDETVRQTRALLSRPEVVALYGFAGTANVGQLLTGKVLEEGQAALVAPYTGGESLRKPFNPWVFHLRAGYADETEHMVRHLSEIGVQRIAVVYQDDGFGQAGLAGVEAALTSRGLQLAARAPYPRNTDDVTAAVRTIKGSNAQAVIMIAINRAAAAFIRQYREAGGGAQLYNISVVNPAEIVRLAGIRHAHGLGISQVVPFPYTPTLPVIREYQTLLARHAPGQGVNYTSFEQFLGAKVLTEALRRAGPRPTRERVMRALESIQQFDLGGVRVGFGPEQRVGSRFVEVTVIGASGRLLK